MNNIYVSYSRKDESFDTASLIINYGHITSEKAMHINYYDNNTCDISNGAEIYDPLKKPQMIQNYEIPENIYEIFEECNMQSSEVINILTQIFCVNYIDIVDNI